MTLITEQPSPHRHLETKTIEELTALLNKEDATVTGAIHKTLPQLNRLISVIVTQLKKGGRLFYLGAGDRKSVV